MGAALYDRVSVRLGRPLDMTGGGTTDLMTGMPRLKRCF